MHVVVLPSTQLTSADYLTIPAKAANGGEVPVARVGHSAAVIDTCIYVFGGRGGPDMAALEENGRVWCFDTRTDTWSHLDLADGSPYPEVRSYHTATATSFPLPSNATPNISNVLLNEKPQSIADLPEPPAAATYGTLFIHAGCLSSGGRTSDLWAFDISSRTWAQFPSAPGAPRGGTSLVMVRDRLYRFGGFNGKTEEGGQIDFLDVNTQDTANGKGGAGQSMALSPRGEWRSNIFAPESDKDDKGGNRTAPANRSVLGLAPVTTGQGREYLLIICGEGEASTVGHAGAGRFFDDVWSFELKPEGGTAASVKDATREYVLNRGTGEATCVEVKYLHGDQGNDAEKEGVSLGEGGGRMAQEGQEKPMGRRGWFSCSPCEDLGGGSVLVWGGIDESNERLGDGWIITVE